MAATDNSLCEPRGSDPQVLTLQWLLSLLVGYAQNLTPPSLLVAVFLFIRSRSGLFDGGHRGLAAPLEAQDTQLLDRPSVESEDFIEQTLVQLLPYRVSPGLVGQLVLWPNP